MKKLLTLVLLFGFIQACIGLEQAKTSMVSEEKKDDDKKVIGSILNPRPRRFTKEMVLASILRSALENMHLTKKQINDDLSQKAFDLYIERLDYGKQFLLKDDVKSLGLHKKQMDDQMFSGNIAIVDHASKVLNERIKMVREYVKKLMKSPLNLEEKLVIQTDSEKRDFAKDESTLKLRWKKILTYQVISRVADYVEEQKGVNDDKKKKKKKKKEDEISKNATLKDLEKKAREKIWKKYDKVFARYLEEKREYQLDKFYNSIIRVYDPHTVYLIPEEKEDFDIDMSGKLEGIGAVLREEGSYIKVERIVPGSASWKGKELKEEDVILAVGQDKAEPVDIVDMSIRDAVKLIRGPKGTVVKLTVKKPDGTVKVVPIIRDVVVIEESYVKSAIIESKKLGVKVGYITVPKFYRDFNRANGRNCSEDVRVELEKLKTKGVDGVILNLRNNGGGALEDARIMSGLFIKKGPIVQVKSGRGKMDKLVDNDPKISFKKPLVVMTNRFSASASEIVAAALQDYDRAVVVGTPTTHGKGTVQAVLDLDGQLGPQGREYSPLGALKLTIQMFYRITGGSTQFKGVTPDIQLPDQFGYMESGERSMDYAIPYAELPSLKYDTWKKNSYSVSKLKQASKERVKKNKKFSKIQESVAYFKKRREETVQKLSLKHILKEREQYRKKTKEFENDAKSEELKIVLLQKPKDDVQKESFKEFQEALEKDPYLEEAVYIMHDMVSTQS
jgi:carboxyl-terminal processing protease